MIGELAEKTKSIIRSLPRLRLQTAAARAVQADVYEHHTTHGIGGGWTDPDHGEYMTKSVPIYSAIMTRANAMTRIPWIAHTRNSQGDISQLPWNHPAQQVLNQPNPWFSGAALRRVTEMFLNLYGQLFWSIERSNDGSRWELWPLRPDRMTILPGKGPGAPYIRGYRYRGLTGDVLYLPEEIEWFRFDNPLQDRTGLSPMAPMRMSADMGLEALKYNRATLRNQAIPDFMLLASEEMTDTEVAVFYERWEKRFGGPNNANRPAIASNISDIKALTTGSKDYLPTVQLRATVLVAQLLLEVRDLLKRSS